MGRQSSNKTEKEAQLTETYNQETARQIRELRCLMGLTQKEVYEPLNMNPGQYSRIESGELTGTEVLRYIRKELEKWKRQELRRLEARMQYIESL